MKKIVLFLMLAAVLVSSVSATTFAGRDNENTTYYVCRDNKEVAELLNCNEDEFDLAHYNIVAKKATNRKEGDGVGLYVVMLNADKSFVVCYRADEYDIFFYSEKKE